MEEPTSRIKSANSVPLSKCELVILHTAEAQEWAAYLQQILKSSRKFSNKSILLYAVSSADQLHEYKFEYFHSCKCIVLVLTGVFMDILNDPELQGALQKLLYPSHRVVVLLCGVYEDGIVMDRFADWPSWRKVYTDDEPAVYVSTILDSIANSGQAEAERKSEAAAAEELHIEAASSAKNTACYSEEVVSQEPRETVLEGEEPENMRNSATEEMSSCLQPICLTVQPQRVLCGDKETIFIIFRHKVTDQEAPQVEFSSENAAPKRVPGIVENEYTLSVTAPDMPAGVVSLTMCTGQSRTSLKSVTYYTNMGEVSRCLENAAEPMNFICQAFNITSDATESLDNILTDSLKSKMPTTSLQLFGIRQIEEHNMAAYQRNEELPTLLHFAAKYGLKKLTTMLLQSPGAVQAYSVMNKNGDYPNTLAEKSGFSDLRHFMDKFVETADMAKFHLGDEQERSADVYEMMSTSSQDIMMISGCPEDIYESMLEITPECAEDLYEVMNSLEGNPEEAMLRTFFQTKKSVVQDKNEQFRSEQDEKDDQHDLDQTEEEEDPYSLHPEDIYDTVDVDSSINPAILYRPPAPIPRPEVEPQAEKSVAYISRVFSDKDMQLRRTMETGQPAGQPAMDHATSVYDPYAGMKTPGQRQLISLQERVKVGEITVDEAVQEFKAWQIDHERRATSIRYQQENLKRLRDSITRRHKEREKTGKELEYEISAPIQRNLYWGSNVTLECAVYESSPQMSVPLSSTPQLIQRGGWKTGSTSSTSSSESNRLSSHSNFSYSSGTEPEIEDTLESIALPPRPTQHPDAAPLIPPNRIPPPIPERVPERMPQERYTSCPTRALPHRPSQRPTNSAPPIPRRLR